MMDLRADLQQAFDEGYEQAKKVYQKAFEDIKEKLVDLYDRNVYGEIISTNTHNKKIDEIWKIIL